MGAINEEMGAFRRLSAVALKRKRYAEARRHAEKAFDLVQRIGSKYETAQIEEIFGDVEIEQDRRTDALRHYEKAAALYTALSKYRLALKLFSKIGLIHAQAGNTFEARRYLDRAQDYVRADIGHELPEEYNALQRQLRGRTARPQLNVPETQRIMLAFYEMSALTDYAKDGREFFARLSDAVKEIAAPNQFVVALAKENGALVTIDPSGAPRPAVDAGLVSLFSKTLSRGSLLDSRSPEAADVAADIEIPGGGGFVSIPLKAMGEDVGCLVMFFDRDHFPLSTQDVNFFTWFGRQIAASVTLMLHLNPGFLKEEEPAAAEGPRSGGEAKPRFENLIGKSEPMRKIFRTLEKIKDTDSGILILGESGTGKSALARAITTGARGGAGRSARSTARRSRTASSRASSSATRGARSPGRRTGRWGSARPRTAALSFSTTSTSSPTRSRRSFSGSSRTRRSSGWEERRISWPMSASSRRATRTSRSSAARGASARTSTSGSR